MALNAESLKNPKVLLIGGVFVIAGIYISSQIKKKSDASKEPPTEITPAVVSVQSNDSTEKQDSTERALADAQSKLAELEKNAREKTDTDRNGRVPTQENENSALIASLRSQIEELTRRANTPSTVPTINQGLNPIRASGGTGGISLPVVTRGDENVIQPVFTPRNPVQQPITPVQTQPVAQPTPTPVPNDDAHNYPGYGYNYKYDCGTVAYRGFLVSWDSIIAQLKSKGLNNTTLARQATQIAVGGFPKNEAIRGGEIGPIAGGMNRIQINQQRVFSGLYPLTVAEFNEMQKHMLSMWNGSGEPSLTYARALFDRWNVPYRCGTSARRF